MKLQWVFVFVIVSGISMCFSQNKLDLSFNDVLLVDAIKEIEKKTDVKFFFQDEWLSGERISMSFQDISLERALKNMFDGTSLNFYILNGRDIILSNNIAIYDAIHSSFFIKDSVFSLAKDSLSQKAKINTPIFSDTQPVNSNTKYETYRVGKENIKSSRKIATLSGYIFNYKNGKALENISINIPEHNLGTETNKNGYYELKLTRGNYILEIGALGFEKIKSRVLFYNDGQLDFQLAESFEDLDEVVINSDVNKNVQESITGVSRIDVERVKTIPLVLGERDIFKVATTLPGISRTGEGSSGFNVRGGKEDQNLVLLENSTIYNPSHFFGLFSAINPFTTENVNIYKGSIPAQFGGRLSSVFDIQAKVGNKKEFSGEGAVGPVTSNLHFEIPVVKDQSSLILGGRGTYSGWILRSLDEPSLRNSEASFYDGILKYDHKIDAHNQISATGYYSADKYSITSDSLFGYTNSSIALKWNHDLSNKHKSKLHFSNSRYGLEINYDAEANDDFDLDYDINESYLQLDLNYRLNDTYQFHYGLSTKLYTVNPGSISPSGQDSAIDPIEISGEKGLENALFLSGDIKLSDKWALYSGFRLSSFSVLGQTTQKIYDDNQPKSQETVIDTLSFGKNEFAKTYFGPELRLSARYLLNENTSIKASFNTTYQYIHTLTNNTTAAPTDTWKLSDFNIEPQRASQIALGFYKNLNDNLYEISLEGYLKQSRNLLDYKVGAQLLLNQSLETEVLQGEGRSYGIELLLKKRYGRLNGWLAYTYSRSKIRLDSKFNEERVNNGDFFPTNFDKPHDLSLIANYKLTKRFSLSANFIYQTGRPVTFPVGSYNFNDNEYVIYSDRNKFRIPDFYRLDLGFNVEGNHKLKKLAHSFWNISIYNVLGRNNPYSVFFVNKDGEIKAFQSSIFSIPIPTITYNFKF